MSFFRNLLLVLPFFLFSYDASAAAVDVTTATAAITENLASVTSVGLAILGILAAVVAFSLIRRVMSGR
jgi:hypothetical protein